MKSNADIFTETCEVVYPSWNTLNSVFLSTVSEVVSSSQLLGGTIFYFCKNLIGQKHACDIFLAWYLH